MEAKNEDLELGSVAPQSPASPAKPAKKTGHVSSHAGQSDHLWSQQFWALLKRNLLLKQRQWKGALAEVLLPVAVMAMMVGIRLAVTRSDNAASLHLDKAADFNYTLANGYLQTQLPRTSFMVAFAPDTAPVRAMRSQFIADNGLLYNTYSRMFGSEDAIDDYVEDKRYAKFPDVPGVWAAVIVDKVGSATPGDLSWKYRIKMNGTGQNNNRRIVVRAIPDSFDSDKLNNLQLGYSGEWTVFARFGYTFLQQWLESYMVNVSTGYNSLPQFRVQPFPTVEHVSDDFSDVISGFLGLLFTLVFLWPVTRLVDLIVSEKESRIKEGMKMMGLRDSALWISWLVTYAIIFFFIALAIICVTWTTVYELSNKGLVLLFFFLFGLSVFSFCYFISAFFSRARVASTMSAIVFLVAFFPYYSILSGSSGSKAMACLSAPVCFGLGATTITELESAQQGLTFSSIDSSIDNFSMVTYFIMITVDIILYLLLAFYFDRTIPQTYGVPMPHCFCCRPSYWRQRKANGSVRPAHGSISKDSGDEEAARGQNVEPVPDVMAEDLGIKVRHLRKEFPSTSLDGAPFVAVKDLNINMYTGQIFALLGHNGAGKTTTINMLSGMFPPTKGDAVVYDNSIVNDLATIRTDLGVCPQHDILYPHLTVREHLALFGSIKGMPEDTIAAEVEDMVNSVGLVEKIDTMSGSLSGGQKRKLSVAIALLGGSRVVFLDEPTSGMDPYSRRSTWELLREAKKDRVIILTTHFMDEADELGDRIAIMAHGEIKCCGSSLYLKNRYGVGYTMTLSMTPKADKHKLTELISGKVHDAETLSSVGGELSFRLPLEASATFPELFRQLDSNMNGWGVDSYGISVTTLEEVFLRVGRDEAALKAEREKVEHDINVAKAVRSASMADEHKLDQLDEQTRREANQSVEDFSEFSALSNKRTAQYEDSSLWKHFKALWMKRYHNARRDRKVVMWQLVYPFFILIAFIGLIKLGQSISRPAIELGTFQYNSPNRVPFDNSTTSSTYPITGLTSQTWGGNSVGLPTNVTSDLEMSQYLLDSYFTYRESRYGAYNFHSFGGGNDRFTVFINTTSTYALPIYYNLYSNMVMQRLSGGDASAYIDSSVQSLPITSDQQALQSSLTAMVLSLGFAFIPASFVAFLVKERVIKSKHQQLISGVNIWAYWGSTYVWDVINFMIPGMLAVLVIVMYDIETLLEDATPATILAVFLYAISVAPFAYALSFLFTNPSTAQNLLLLGFFFTGGILLVVSIILDIIESTQDANKVLKFFYRLIPSFCFGESIAGIIVRDTAVVNGEPQGPWEMDVSGWPFLYMALEAPLYFLLVIFIEYVQRTPRLMSFFSSSSMASIQDQPHEDDPDIVTEAERVLKGDASDDVIRLEHLRKVYPGRFGTAPKVAVKDLTFGIPQGECFGFLGINGAGKTTTLQMLTGDQLPTSGTAFLGGLDIATDQAEIRKMIGYTPQFDALLDSLTAREHLFLFARIKGMVEADIPHFAQKMISAIGLEEYADKPCGGYSGGNKRKLSVGMALIGDPKIVFLDEPSTGMDPGARRFMWNLISTTMSDRSVVLTTHSMEECEALCGRIGIMVGGRLRCLGSAAHLKSRYGEGYQVSLNTGGQVTAKAEEFVADKLPFAVLLERHPSSLKYRVPKGHMKLADLFELVETNKQTANISEYSISETTLEQIFIHFAQQQEEEPMHKLA